LNALILYATRYGATNGTADLIAKILQEKKVDVKIVNAKEENVKDISEYGLIVVGSGMSMGNWVGQAEDFLKKFHKDLEDKRVALFISSLKPVEEKAGKTGAVARTRRIGLDDKILKYHLKPLSVGFFGGVLDYNKMSFLTRKAMEIGYKSQLQQNGFKEAEPDVYDLRNLDEIQSWARELAQKAKE
jgi:menaquinone-dependent protoporphyrinogen IX oxidase